jgi:hypothetical protein
MLVWRGFGIAVPFIWGLLYFLMTQVFGPGKMDERGREGMNPLAAGVGSLVAAAAAFALYKVLENKGREDGEDAFWFIPVKFWPILFGIGGLIGIVLHFTQR